MTSQLLVLDTFDDRREIARLLGHLPPVERIRFLQWCCTQVPPHEKGHLPVPEVRGLFTTAEYAGRNDEADARLTREVYGDLLSLFAHFSLDAAKTAVALEARVKRWQRK